MIKNEEKRALQNIDEIKDRINKTIINIKEKEKQYNIINNEYKYIIKNFYKDNNNMNEIYNIVGVLDVNKILEKFKKLKQKYNELSSNTEFKSKEIISLNEELTTLNKTYDRVLIYIKDKKNDENIDIKLIQYKCNLEKLSTKIETKKIFLIKQYDIFKEKIEVLSKCISFILRIMNKIINSTKNSIYKDTFIIYKEINKNMDLIIIKYQEYYKNNFIKNYIINYDKEIFNKKFLKFIIFLINELKYRISTITNNIYNAIYKNEINIKLKEKEFELKNNNEKENLKDLGTELNDINEINLDIFPFNTKKFYNIIINELKRKRNILEEKKKFYKSEEKYCLQNKNLKKKMFRIYCHQ